MEKTRVICFRMPESLLARLIQLSRHTYNKSRSQVVLQLLKILTECADDATLYKMIQSYDAFSQGYTVHFVKDKKTIS